MSQQESDMPLGGKPQQWVHWVRQARETKASRLLLPVFSTVMTCTQPGCELEFVIFGVLGTVLTERDWINFCPYCGHEATTLENQ